MSRLAKRLERMEREKEGPGRIFFTTIDENEIPEGEHAAFLAAEQERLGVGDGDLHFVTIYERKPT